jgi:lipopolysaccharide/colanic/teichoic acid biosynthesis glycosyltransferase
MTLGGEGYEGLDLDICHDFEDVGLQLREGNVDHVMVQLNHDLLSQEEIGELMRTCFRARIRFATFPREKSLISPGVEVNLIEGTGFLSYHPPVLSRSSMIIKRMTDLLIAIPLLIGSALPMLAIAIAIKLDDGGPILFRQRRVGRDSVRFSLLKFRTMDDDADSHVAELMAHSLDPDWLVIEDDPRITRVGRFLRRSSLDELPQLWNVLRGEMSLVGPRPPLSYEVEKYPAHWFVRFGVKPGLTGLWQVSGRSSLTLEEMIRLDVAYTERRSLWLNLGILVRTVPAVLRARGAA